LHEHRRLADVAGNSNSRLGHGSGHASRQVDNAHTKQRAGRLHLFPVAGVVLLIFLVPVIEVMVWSATCLWLGAFEVFERATCFSMITFTAPGYGEIILD
jgi:hypothetical protein